MKKLIFVFVLAGLFGVGADFASAASPSVLTTPPSATSSSITFNGIFMANGSQTTTRFEYSTNQSDVQSGNGTTVCQVIQSTSTNTGTFHCTLNTPTITTGVIYYFRAVASNTDGTTYATNIASIQTIISAPSSAPTVLTTVPTATSSSITLNGIFSDNGAQTTTRFEYSTNQSDVQSGNGLTACQLTQSVGATVVPFTCTLNTPTITAGTTYYFRAIASNINGTVYGSTTSIQTTITPPPSTTPTLVSLSPNNGTQGQTLNVTLNGTNFTSGASTNFGSNISVNFTIFVSPTQLTANITIPAGAALGAYNVTATSGSQTTGVQTFTVNSPNNSCGSYPSISSISPSSVTVGTGATNVVVSGSNFDNSSLPRFNGANRAIVGTISANQITMTLLSTDLSSVGSGSISVANNNCASNGVTFTITANNNGGGGGGGGGYYYSYVSVTTQNAGNISSNSVVLNGSINPNGYTATSWFEYGTSNTLANFSETSHISQGSANSYSALAQSITNLAPNTTYYFRAAANNSYGTRQGNIFSFTTGALNGVVTTVQATSQTSTSARLNGIFVNQSNYSAQGYFEYGTTASLGSTTTTQDLGTSPSVNFSNTVNNFTSGTIYYFRAVVLNNNSVYKGKILVFQTKSAGDTTINTDNNTGPSVTTAQSSILKITTTTDNITAGNEIEYLVVFNNKNSKNFENAKISIQLPKEIDFTESNFGKVNSDNIVELNAGVLVPNQLGSMTIKGKVSSRTPDKSVLVTTAVMTYNITGSTSEHDEIAYVTNHVVSGTGLEANSLFGANFLPSTLLGWLALVLAILGLTIVGRKLYSSFGTTKTNKKETADHVEHLPL
ncbi:MAG: IPT/TIG domain-containing protein [Minisyncoccia bacterium]